MHGEIIEAIRSGDAVGVRALVAHHLRHVQQFPATITAADPPSSTRRCSTAERPRPDSPSDIERNIERKQRAYERIAPSMNDR